MLEAKVKKLFRPGLIEKYEQDSDAMTATIVLDHDQFTLAEFKALEKIFGTDDIDFQILMEEHGALNGDVWMETRLEIYVGGITL